jgi:hypothetical protein
MIFTDQDIENIFDHIKSAGFDIPDDFSNENIEMLANAILDALHLDDVERE